MVDYLVICKCNMPTTWVHHPNLTHHHLYIGLLGFSDFMVHYVANSPKWLAFAGIDRWQKCRPFFPTTSGGHVFSLANPRFSHSGLYPYGASMAKTSAKPITWPVAVEQSTCYFAHVCWKGYLNVCHVRGDDIFCCVNYLLFKLLIKEKIQ